MEVVGLDGGSPQKKLRKAPKNAVHVTSLESFCHLSWRLILRRTTSGEGKLSILDILAYSSTIVPSFPDRTPLRDLAVC